MVSRVKGAVCGRGSVTGVLGFIGLVFLAFIFLVFGFVGSHWLMSAAWHFLISMLCYYALVLAVTWKAIIAIALLFAALRLAFWPSRRRATN